jgi:hypothetical protein
MQVVIGPVLWRQGGYAFDSWTAEEGLSRGYIYRRVEDAHYARIVEIRSRNKGHANHIAACGTVDEFMKSARSDPALPAPASPAAWCGRINVTAGRAWSRS